MNSGPLLEFSLTWNLIEKILQQMMAGFQPTVLRFHVIPRLWDSWMSLEWVLKSACMWCSPRHVTPALPVIRNSWNCSYIRNSHSCINHCRWSALISPSSWIQTSPYVPKHLICSHNAWMPSILFPDKQQKSRKLKTWKWTMKSSAHLDGVHDDLETLNRKTWSFPKTVRVQVPEVHTELLSTHKEAVESITVEEPSRL